MGLSSSQSEPLASNFMADVENADYLSKMLKIYFYSLKIWSGIFKNLAWKHGRNLVGDGGDMSPPLFYPRGTYYVLFPPLFDPDSIIFYRLPFT